MLNKLKWQFRTNWVFRAVSTFLIWFIALNMIFWLISMFIELNAFVCAFIVLVIYLGIEYKRRRR